MNLFLLSGNSVLQMCKQFAEAGYMADADLDSSCLLNKKIRNAQLAQYNFILGKKDYYSRFLFIFLAIHIFMTLPPQCLLVSNFLSCQKHDCTHHYGNIVVENVNVLGQLCLLGFGSVGTVSCFVLCVLAVVGEKEKLTNSVNLRTRDNKVHGELSVSEVLTRLTLLKESRCRNAEEEF